jgi:hypothetical protein
MAVVGVVTVTRMPVIVVVLVVAVMLVRHAWLSGDKFNGQSEATVRTR